MFLKFLTGVAALFHQVLTFFSQRNLLNAGRALNEVENAKQAIEQVRVADDARDTVRTADRDIDSTGRLPNDGFRRD